MRVDDVLEHFLSRSPWVDRSKTVDRVIIGDPAADVDRCLVTWMPTLTALHAAIDRGIRFVICHEPTFWNHRDELTDDPAVASKRRFIEEHGLVIMRNHDCWDRWPEIGIPWAWARHLGFEGAPAAVSANTYQHRYDIAPVAFDALAARLAARCAALGEPAVKVVGNSAQTVTHIGIGTGCACDIATFIQMGCDCSVVCDDGSCTWSNIQRAAEIGHPVIRVNHGTSEEPGMATLTSYINRELTGLHAEHLPHGNTFRLVGLATGQGNVPHG